MVDSQGNSFTRIEEDEVLGVLMRECSYFFEVIVGTLVWGLVCSWFVLCIVEGSDIQDIDTRIPFFLVYTASQKGKQSDVLGVWILSCRGGCSFETLMLIWSIWQLTWFYLPRQLSRNITYLWCRFFIPNIN